MLLSAVCFRTGYTCALQKDILYQGKMFISDNWICFHSKVFGRDTKVRYCKCYEVHVLWLKSLYNMAVFSTDFYPCGDCDIYQKS